jgi:hypothetical protein
VPNKPEPDFLEILRVLTAHEVKFIVVGGVSAVLQGAPFTTFDLDVVHSRDPQNIDRLLRALESLEVYYRTNPGKRARPAASHLLSQGHQLLMSRFGPLDILGMIGRGRQFDMLLPHTIEMEIDAGVKINVLDLQTLIQTKEETAGEKDRALLPVLRKALEEKSRQEN